MRSNPGYLLKSFLLYSKFFKIFFPYPLKLPHSCNFTLHFSSTVMPVTAVIFKGPCPFWRPTTGRMKTKNISRITGSRAVGRSKNLRGHIVILGILKETFLFLDRPKSEGAMGPPAPPFPTALGGTRLFLAEASSLKMQKVGKSGHWCHHEHFFRFMLLHKCNQGCVMFAIINKKLVNDQSSSILYMQKNT